MNQTEHIIRVISARHCDQKWKTCTTKTRIKDENKKDIFQKYKVQNQKHSTPMNL